MQVQGLYAGSTPGVAKMPFQRKAELAAGLIERGLAFNLGQTGATQTMRQARGTTKKLRSTARCPTSTARSTRMCKPRTYAPKVFVSIFQASPIPAVIGPFNYIDLRAHLSQIHFRSCRDQQLPRGERYCQGQSLFGAGRARTGHPGRGRQPICKRLPRSREWFREDAQLQSANAVPDQSKRQFEQGLIAKVDADRNEVQALTHQQRLLSLKNDLAKQKINLARMIGLLPNDQYDLLRRSALRARYPALAVEACTPRKLPGARQTRKLPTRKCAPPSAPHSAARAERHRPARSHRRLRRHRCQPQSTARPRYMA